jgi:ribonuclease VapC
MFPGASAIIGIIAMDEDSRQPGRAVVAGAVPAYLRRGDLRGGNGSGGIANTPVADALALVGRFLKEIDAMAVAIDGDTAISAVAAFDRFGKGRHPAALNMGDCFAYACARQGDVKLLCKGNDFPGLILRWAERSGRANCEIATSARRGYLIR